MKTMKKTGQWAALLCGGMVICLVSAVQVQAQVIDGSFPDSVGEVPHGDSADSWKFTIGAGAAIVPDYEGSDDYDFVPAPLFRASKGPMHVSLLGAKITSNLINHESWRFGPMVNFRRKRGDVDNNRVQAMDTIDATAEVGAKAGYDMILPEGVLSFEAEFLHDVGDEHAGWTAGPQITYKNAWDKWNFAMQGAVDFASRKFMHTYFGVGPGNTGSSGFSKYRPDAGYKDFRFTTSLGYQFNPSWGIVGLAQWKQLGGDADNSSPVVKVGDKSQALVGAFVTYTFGQSS